MSDGDSVHGNPIIRREISICIKIFSEDTSQALIEVDFIGSKVKGIF